MTEQTKKRQFNYRGQTIEELKALDVREFAKLLPSRHRRFVLRNFQKIEDFLNRSRVKLQKKKPIKTHARDLVIVPQMVGMRIQVHNGKGFLNVDVVSEMLGHKLGEFSLTRNKVAHSKAGVGATKGSRALSKK